MQFLRLVLLPALLVLPGLVIWLGLRLRIEVALGRLEQALVVLIASAFVTGWSALVLAEFGRFSLPTLLLLTTILTLTTHLTIRRLLPISINYSRLSINYSLHDLLALALLSATLLTSIPAHHYFIGGRDHGIYINTGIHISKSGGILLHDELLPELPAANRDVLVNPKVNPYQSGLPGPWSEGQRLAGLTIRDTAEGIAAPHAFHFYPALIAVFATTAGAQAAIYATVYAGMLGLLAIYLTIKRVVSEQIGLIVLLLLCVNVAVRWYLRTPSAEILVTLYFWVGAWALSVAESQTVDAKKLLTSALSRGVRGSSFFLIFAAICFGATHLAKLDTVFIPVALLVYGGYLWLTCRFTRAHWAATAVYLLVSLHAVLHAWFVSTIYFIDHLVRVILPDFLDAPLIEAARNETYPSAILGNLLRQNGVTLLLIIVAAVLGLLLLKWLRPLIARLLNTLAPRAAVAQIVLAIPLALYVGWNVLQLLTNQLTPYDSWFVGRLYVTRIGVLVGALGVVWAVVRVRGTAARLLLWLLLVNGGYLFVLGHQTASDHFWIARRFVPIAIPGLLLAGVWLVDDVAKRLPRVLRLGAVWGFVALMLLGMLPHSLNKIDFVELESVWAQTEAFSAEMTPNDVLLFPASGPAYRFTLPLWLLFDRNVYQIEEANWDAPLVQQTVGLWQAQGRNVFWAEIPAFAAPGWVRNSAEIQARHRIQVQLMEQPTDRIPSRAVDYDLTITLHKFR